MSDERDDPGGGPVRCRSCGNRVARGARRCPACGTREPAGPEPAHVAAAPSRPRVAVGVAFAAGVLAGMAVTAAVFVFALRPAATPPGIGGELATPTPPPAPAVSAPSPPAPVSPAVTSRPEPSRSRGRTDWLFFFKPGDQLVSMTDEAPIGMVIRVVPQHAFVDGTMGPAYVLQLPDGAGQRLVDADELERGGRLQ
jgi:hypothetical protein